MLQIVMPIFAVILVGYVFGRRNQFSAEAQKLINDYVLYIALPALLFLAVARADPQDLAQWEFVLATLTGIFVAYIAGILLARYRKVRSPQTSLVGMASCYGTTGYMGIPIVIAAFGPEAAVPAAIATILHNIPAIMTVIITHDVSEQARFKILKSIWNALITTFTNPLTVAVLAGVLVSVLKLPIPTLIVSFSEFLAAAAGPTALFALGLGLSKISFSRESLAPKINWILPVMSFKILLQPMVTAFILLLVFNSSYDVWVATAIVMAAQPIGAGVYVFANKYRYFVEETSLAIVLSLIVTVITLTVLLEWLGLKII